MSVGARSLSFSITGEFVTKTARDWFWLEGKPWAVVEELLLSCMCGTDKPVEELKRLAMEVILGRAKFIGCSGDDTYAMTDDNRDLLVENVESMRRRIKTAEEERDTANERYCELVERLEDEGYGWLVRYEEEEPSPILKGFLEQREIEKEHQDNYGWLEPDGTFHPVEFAEHNGFALEVIKSKGWMKDFSVSDVGGIYACGDFLTEERGWVLLHNPGLGVAYVTKSDARALTKAQKEFLFGYYTDRGKHDLAKEYLED